ILALAKPGPTRSPKAIKTISSNSILNAIKDFPSSESSSEPIIIDLLPSSSTLSPGISSSASTTKKYPEVRTTALVQSSTVPITRTKAPVVITAKSKTTIQPKTTTQAPIGFASLWRALFGSNRFEASTIASAKKNPKSVTPRSVQATQKSIEITPKPVQIIKSTTRTSHIMSAIRSHATPRSVDISDIQVISTKSHADNIDSTSSSTLSPISTQRTLLNNPNPRLNDVPTSTYSSEDDSKFLVALLRAIQTETKTSTSTTTPKIIEDEEAFLRAILNNQASISTAIPSSTELNPAALLALLLKQQGIEPSTPATKFREQLQLASLDLTTTRSMTTTTNRATFSSSTQSAVSTRKTTTTPRRSLRPSERTSGYTWSPSSTYPPPLFGENSGSGLITATRAIGQFLGAAITGAAQQLQSFLRNGTRSIAG
ncbi:probable serine/threonine-protein kinase nek3, partial [Formica exsecta]|uniref:probable serine/threonine-protein kinase nek3 n=1 Tax=Formica exsecta TaxID=72781 RepID=UPI0011439E7E